MLGTGAREMLEVCKLADHPFVSLPEWFSRELRRSHFWAVWLILTMIIVISTGLPSCAISFNFILRQPPKVGVGIYVRSRFCCEWQNTERNSSLYNTEAYFSLIVKKLEMGCPGPVQDPIHGAGIQGSSVSLLHCHQHGASASWPKMAAQTSGITTTFLL